MSIIKHQIEELIKNNRISISVETDNDFIELQEYLFSLSYEWIGGEKIIKKLPYNPTYININMSTRKLLTYSQEMNDSFLFKDIKNEILNNSHFPLEDLLII